MGRDALHGRGRVGPRRALQKLYGTPELKAARPWAPILNWVVIASLYVLTYFVVAGQWLVFAKVPGDDVPTHVAATWEYVVVFTANLALALVVWTRVAAYTRTLMASTDAARDAQRGAQSKGPGAREAVPNGLE